MSFKKGNSPSLFFVKVLLLNVHNKITADKVVKLNFLRKICMVSFALCDNKITIIVSAQGRKSKMIVS